MTEEYLRVLKTHDMGKIRRYQRYYNHTGEPSNIIELTGWIRLVTVCLGHINELVARQEEESMQYVTAEFNLVQFLQESAEFYAGDEQFPDRAMHFSPNRRMLSFSKTQASSPKICSDQY